MCRLQVAGARPLFEIRESHLPTTLLVLTASPADRAVPQKPASQEIARSAPLDPKNGPTSALLRFLYLLSSASWVPRLCAPAHVAAIRPQSCTSGKSPLAPVARVIRTNHNYLEKIGFDPQKRRATRLALCIRDAPRQKTKFSKIAKSVTRPKPNPHPQARGEFVFRPNPTSIRDPMSSAIRAQ